MPTPNLATDPAPLLRRVRDLIRDGRVNAARPLLAALHRAAPLSTELDELEARLQLREGHAETARNGLDAALRRCPGAPALLLRRAEARLHLNDFTGAAADAADAVIAAPRDTEAKVMLGVVLIELDRPADAVACLGEAVAAEPLHPAYRQALAEAQERAGDQSGAARTLADGIALIPGSVTLRTVAITAAMRRRDFGQAENLAAAARADGVADACVFGLLGHALSSLARHEEAAEAYAEALKLAPEDPYVRHLVRASGVLPGAPRAPAEYLRAVFEGYAGRFEMHLVELGYRVPGLVRAALLRHLRVDPAAGAAIGPVLDLGCGTGLMGVVLSDLNVAPLTGVDLSPAMLREAEGKGLYASLREADLETVLAEPGPDWPVILAADVLIYFGALDGVLGLVRPRLRRGGLLVFSVEEVPAAVSAPACGWRLERQGRYQHTRAYIRAAAAAAGLDLLELRAEPLRNEGGAPVPGLLVVLQRSRHDG